MIILVFLSAIFSVSAISLASAGATSQEVIPLDSYVYEGIDSLYLLQGLGTATTSRPWTKAQARLIFNRIDGSRLSGAFRASYDVIEKEISSILPVKLDDVFRLGGGASASFEAYAHANTQDFMMEKDWVRGFTDRRPLLKLNLDLSAGNWGYIHSDLQYGRSRYTSESYSPDGTGDGYGTDTQHGIGVVVPSGKAGFILPTSLYSMRQHFQSSMSLTTALVDIQTPKRAVFSVGGGNWNVSLAKDRLSWGNGHSGNFIVDDHVDFHDYLRFTAFGDRFAYDSSIIFLDTNFSSSQDPDTDFRIFLLHRLEFRPWDTVTLVVSENVMYKNDVANLSYLNPAYIYHNLNNHDMFNAIAHAELDWAFSPGWNVYGQFVLDQARAPHEDASQKGAWGLLGGVEHACIVGAGILTTSLEAAMTTPVLYRRDEVDFLMFRKYFVLGQSGEYRSFVLNPDYIGYPYGGDALVLQWDVSWRVPGQGVLGFRLMGMRHGKMNLLESHHTGGNNEEVPDYPGATPSGTADEIETRIHAQLSGEWQVMDRPNVSARVSLDWVGAWNKYSFTEDDGSGMVAYRNLPGFTHDFQLTAGITVSI